ncbi:hypothetical protein [Nocardia sp. NPDC052112]|uniref:aromatic-ring hydroxylase C-terminal domain-containing protein n=1 Tax=Nocardia sp. NPDC052112 TaxID=3155646 RepID=UPI00344A5909
MSSTEDIEIVLDGTSGSRLPHTWVTRNGNRRSTFDLIESRCTLLIGRHGAAWPHATPQVADRLLVPLPAVVIEASDWPERVGITDRGALLVRPGQSIGWHAPTTPPDPAAGLARALARLLDRTVGQPTWAVSDRHVGGTL